MLTREGDVLLVPAEKGRLVVGQAVRVMGTSFLLATFSAISDEEAAPDPGELDLSEPVFLAETVDQSVESGRWKVIGNRRPDPGLPIPVFKVQVGLGGDYHLQDHRGEIGRKATAEEARRLRAPRSYSPALVEQALRAHQGHDDWLDVFDDMRADPERHVGDIF
ncbi:hypothetical protein HII36_46345 [Nonomuraea sp. NN258]|uniref:hypothetical protein n=1 Tax=Nonomuraea antri TaxID=2730852 RepID=UPI0015698829|nr:hypothetical protein [Nonomuraea antri]NRQ39194.1 hypothetical protein [Nonomuraea antri]